MQKRPEELFPARSRHGWSVAKLRTQARTARFWSYLSVEQGQFFRRVQGQENLYEELLVFCFQRQGEAIDDAKMKHTQTHTGDTCSSGPDQEPVVRMIVRAPFVTVKLEKRFSPPQDLQQLSHSVEVMVLKDEPKTQRKV